MKTKGRARSTNVIDRRSPASKDNASQFLRESQNLTTMRERGNAKAYSHPWNRFTKSK